MRPSRRPCNASNASRRSLRRRLVVFVVVLSAWSGPVASAAPRTALQRRIDGILSGRALRGTAIGCRVIDVASGKVLYSYHATDPLLPASNMKLATTAAALETLGLDYAFVTRVGLVGRDLVVIGAGDPNISGRFHDGNVTAVFEGWAKALAAKGVTRIEGDLIADDTLFDRQYVHPTWPREQLHRWYCAPVGALSLNDNCADVTVLPASRPGLKAVVRVAPPGGYVTIVNAARTVSRGRLLVSFGRHPGASVITVRGRVPAGARGYTESVTIDDPGAFFAATLKHVLAQHGVTVRGECRPAAAPTDLERFRPLAEHRSTLVETVKVTNTRSQNFYAECLFKLLGAKSGGAPGTFGKGAVAVERFLAMKTGRKTGKTGKTGDTNPKFVSPVFHFTVADGSGLSRRNRLSAMHITNLLRYMAGRPSAKVFRNSLATAGVDGGLKRRMAEAPFRGRVHAKTGTIRGVSALSGYADTCDGRTLAFSILINNHRRTAAQMRTLQDDVCRTLVGSTP